MPRLVHERDASRASAEEGLTAHAWRFTSSSVGELSAALFTLLREHRLWLPNDRDLLDELRTVRLRENSQGAIRLDHDPSRHDDRAVSLGLAVMLCQENQTGRARISMPHHRMLTPNVRATGTVRTLSQSAWLLRAGADHGSPYGLLKRNPPLRRGPAISKPPRSPLPSALQLRTAHSYSPGRERRPVAA